MKCHRRVLHKAAYRIGRFSIDLSSGLRVPAQTLFSRAAVPDVHGLVGSLADIVDKRTHGGTAT
eukprot:2294513-Amphidinium_carterae.1